MRARLPLILGGLVVLGLFGCSGDEGRKPVHPARGQVLYQGKPIPHAQITLISLDPGDQDTPRPTARVGADGCFILTTYEGNDGAPAGEYAVTVDCWLSTATARTKESDNVTVVNRLPAKYSRPESSGLKVRIEPGDNQLPTIKLSR